MNVNSILSNSVMVLLVIVLVIYVIMLLLPTTKHKFVSDVTKIQLDINNELLNESCYWASLPLKPIPSIPPSGTKPIPKTGLIATLIEILPPTVLAILSLTIPGIGKLLNVKPNECSNLPKDKVDSLRAPFGISKLQAEQFYLNNSVVIDQVYKDKDTLECFRNFVNAVAKLEGAYPNKTSFEESSLKSVESFVKCFMKLSNVERENISNLTVSLVMSVVESGPRKVLMEKLLKY